MTILWVSRSRTFHTTSNTRFIKCSIISKTQAIKDMKMRIIWRFRKKNFKWCLTMKNRYRGSVNWVNYSFNTFGPKEHGREAWKRGVRATLRIWLYFLCTLPFCCVYNNEILVKKSIFEEERFQVQEISPIIRWNALDWFIELCSNIPI